MFEHYSYECRCKHVWRINSDSDIPSYIIKLSNDLNFSHKIVTNGLVVGFMKHNGDVIKKEGVKGRISGQCYCGSKLPGKENYIFRN